MEPKGEGREAKNEAEEEGGAASPLAAGEEAARNGGRSPPTEDDAPVGPAAEEEVAFLAQERETEGASKLAPTEDGEPGGLPPLEDLVKRIPAPTRQLLDELFRVKFVTVKRVPKHALKS